MADHTNHPVPSLGIPASDANTPAGIIFPSAIRTAATYTSEPLINASCKGVRLYINRTVATGTVVFSVEGRDPVTDAWVAITGATTPSLTTAIATTLTIYPGITAAAGTGSTSTETSTFLPNQWRVKAIVSTDTTTWSIAGEYLL